MRVLITGEMPQQLRTPFHEALFACQQIMRGFTGSPLESGSLIITGWRGNCVRYLWLHKLSHYILRTTGYTGAHERYPDASWP